MDDDEVDVRLYQNEGVSTNAFANVSNDENENDDNKNGVDNGNGNGDCDCDENVSNDENENDDNKNGVDNGNGNGNGDCDCDCDELSYNRDSLRDCHESRPPRRRTLDEFLESGFQASKGLALSSAPPPSSSVQSTSSYHFITRTGSFEDECGSGESGDVHRSNNNTSSNNTSNNNSNIKSTNIPLRALSLQRRYWCIILSLGVANSSDATEILCISHILGDSFFRSEMLLSDENENGNSGGG
eukprot:CAMPEP_0172378364 /NCGR_PEP_ID=MMETSP1060-20121228/69384_1 /TAXON_ID=37318 /ORGANISM="Pseudo-nitzschia pungens, Strain cf. cingulata" /LENGTH=242 /DNA_ID=CAMNT_0013106081 /DNA_START=4720 /DNA_END=5445 /DNA_ORIENTATION=+